jgi:hypothetical protein
MDHIFNIKMQLENGAENEKTEGNIYLFQVVYIQRKRETMVRTQEHGNVRFSLETLYSQTLLVHHRTV